MAVIGTPVEATDPAPRAAAYSAAMPAGLGQRR